VADLPSVCVIGAGVSGLTSRKALRDFGGPHTCFAASDEVADRLYFLSRQPGGVQRAWALAEVELR
jgi:cation diffusion facilitator CzcD-associated flavoprotein CzcO